MPFWHISLTTLDVPVYCLVGLTTLNCVPILCDRQKSKIYGRHFAYTVLDFLLSIPGVRTTGSQVTLWFCQYRLLWPAAGRRRIFCDLTSLHRGTGVSGHIFGRPRRNSYFQYAPTARSAQMFRLLVFRRPTGAEALFLINRREIPKNRSTDFWGIGCVIF